jgi:ABC-type Fe3+-hydroxamate transport system substrate-binding protein
MFLATLSVVLAIGCTKAPSPAPISASSNTTDVEITIPDSFDEDVSVGESEPAAATDEAANEKLVSLNVPGMH